MKRIKYGLLSTVMCLSVLFGTSCGNESVNPPDYSSYSHQFGYYGYNSAYNGTYKIDGSVYNVGENFLTAEQFKLYKDCGFTYFYPGSVLKVEAENAAYPGIREESWGRVKGYIDLLVESGLDKTYLYDEGLSWLGLKSNRSLIGEGNEYEFHSEEELDAKVYDMVKMYADYPGIWGITMADEPKYEWVESYADLYKSINRVNEKYGLNIHIQYNLNPLVTNSDNVFDNYYPHVEGTDTRTFENCFIRYKKYITDFMDAMQPDFIQYDQYPLRVRNGKEYVQQEYIPCLQYVAGVARDRNIDFHCVTETFEMKNDGVVTTRKINEKEAKWLNNILVGFGVNEISYFTYYTQNENTTEGESFLDGSSFVNYYGQTTEIYDFMKKIMADNQKFAPTVLNFDYQASKVINQTPMNYANDHIVYVDNSATFVKLKDVSVDKECALITELHDKENDRYMYMLMNIVDPAIQGSKVYETITADFGSEYKYAVSYRDGESVLYKLENGKMSIKAAPGEASFIIPFN